MIVFMVIGSVGTLFLLHQVLLKMANRQEQTTLNKTDTTGNKETLSTPAPLSMLKAIESTIHHLSIRCQQTEDQINQSEEALQQIDMKYVLLNHQLTKIKNQLEVASKAASTTQSTIEKMETQLANHLSSLIRQGEEIKNIKEYEQTVNNALKDRDQSLDIYHEKINELQSSCENLANDIKVLFSDINDIETCFLNIQSQLQKDNNALAE